MEQLPYIDEHVAEIDAAPEQVWAALLAVLRREFGGATRIAGLLGCDPAHGTAQFEGRPGQTLPGFLVVEAEPTRRLVLQGRHRFSRYDLTILFEDHQLRAQTRAVFPGLLGRLYRAAVIGSGAHRVFTRRLLRQVVRRA